MTSAQPYFFTEAWNLRVLELELELHGIFWFHTFAQPRDRYAHVMIPVVHNYPITLALLGLPSEAYSSVSGLRTFAFKPERVWRERGFYAYPAVVRRAVLRILTFSMGGTGYAQFKPRTRAPVPDFTANQVFLPGTVFRTYVVGRGDYMPPPFIRMGSKRYGVFKVRVVRRVSARVEESAGRPVTHPFNVRDVGTRSYQGVLSHYAGAVALGGAIEKVLVAEDAVLALPKFIGGGR